MNLLKNRILHHDTLIQLQQYNPNKFKQGCTTDTVSLKVDESVLMDDSKDPMQKWLPLYRSFVLI